MLEEKPLRINIDFDNTLTQGDCQYWNDETPEPREEMVALAREAYNNGHFITIWTARQWGVANLVAARLTEWGVKYHGIRCNKGSADIYIDDKAVNRDVAIEETDLEALYEEVTND